MWKKQCKRLTFIDYCAFPMELIISKQQIASVKGSRQKMNKRRDEKSTKKELWSNKKNATHKLDVVLP